MLNHVAPIFFFVFFCFLTLWLARDTWRSLQTGVISMRFIPFMPKQQIVRNQKPLSYWWNAAFMIFAVVGSGTFALACLLL